MRGGPTRGHGLSGVDQDGCGLLALQDGSHVGMQFRPDIIRKKGFTVLGAEDQMNQDLGTVPPRISSPVDRPIRAGSVSRLQPGRCPGFHSNALSGHLVRSSGLLPLLQSPPSLGGQNSNLSARGRQNVGLVRAVRTCHARTVAIQPLPLLLGLRSLHSRPGLRSPG